MNSGWRDRCHQCRRLRPERTPVTLPMPPSCSSGSSQHKMPPVPGSRFFTAQSTLGKGSRALAPKGRQRERGRNRIRESLNPRSERHPATVPLRMSAAAPADCAGAPWPGPFCPRLPESTLPLPSAAGRRLLSASCVRPPGARRVS